MEGRGRKDNGKRKGRQKEQRGRGKDRERRERRKGEREGGEKLRSTLRYQWSTVKSSGPTFLLYLR